MKPIGFVYPCLSASLRVHERFCHVVDQLMHKPVLKVIARILKKTKLQVKQLMHKRLLLVIRSDPFPVGCRMNQFNPGAFPNLVKFCASRTSWFREFVQILFKPDRPVCKAKAFRPFVQQLFHLLTHRPLPSVPQQGRPAERCSVPQLPSDRLPVLLLPWLWTHSQNTSVCRTFPLSALQRLPDSAR